MSTSVCRPFQAARDAGAALFVLNGSDVVSEVVGDSEAGMKGAAPPARLWIQHSVLRCYQTKSTAELRQWWGANAYWMKA